MLPRIFITAFDPYDQWSENSSWLALVEFTKQRRDDAVIVTRRYPVDFDEVQRRLEADLVDGYDYALHLGQAPGAARMQLEAIGLNLGADISDREGGHRLLVPEGPVAYRSQLPLDRWVPKLRSLGIPASVSYHAGTYLCNATLYLTHYLTDRHGLPTKATFLHLPLDPRQTAGLRQETASMPSSLAAEGMHLIVEELVKRSPIRDQEHV